MDKSRDGERLSTILGLIAHYAMIAPRLVWAAVQDLEPIRTMCRAELARRRDDRP